MTSGQTEVQLTFMKSEVRRGFGCIDPCSHLRGNIMTGKYANAGY